MLAGIVLVGLSCAVTACFLWAGESASTTHLWHVLMGGFCAGLCAWGFQLQLALAIISVVGTASVAGLAPLLLHQEFDIGLSTSHTLLGSQWFILLLAVVQLSAPFSKSLVVNQVSKEHYCHSHHSNERVLGACDA